MKEDKNNTENIVSIDNPLKVLNNPIDVGVVVTFCSIIRTMKLEPWGDLIIEDYEDLIEDIQCAVVNKTHVFNKDTENISQTLIDTGFFGTRTLIPENQPAYTVFPEDILIMLAFAEGDLNIDLYDKFKEIADEVIDGNFVLEETQLSAMADSTLAFDIYWNDGNKCYLTKASVLDIAFLILDLGDETTSRRQVRDRVSYIFRNPKGDLAARDTLNSIKEFIDLNEYLIEQLKQMEGGR